MSSRFDTEKERWSAFASQVGMTCAEGVQSLIDSYLNENLMQAVFPGQSQQHLKKFLASPVIQFFFDKVRFIHLHGSLHGYNFHIIPPVSQSNINSNDGSNQYASLLLDFPHPYQHQLSIGPAGFFSRLGKKLLPHRQIQIPQDPELNTLLRITCSAEKRSQVQALVSDTRLQHALCELFQFSRKFRINDWGIRYQTSENDPDPQSFLEIMKLMAAAAKNFY